MRFSIEPREGYLLATVHGRETPERTRCTPRAASATRPGS